MRLLLGDLLLTGHSLARTLAAPSVGVGALPTDGESAAVAKALVAADLDLAADVGGHLTAEVTLDLVLLLDPVAQLDQLLVGEVC